MRILFLGDSITDAGRDRRNFHAMGNGYPKYAAGKLTEFFPDTEFEFINLGISGNRTDQLFDRLYPDCIALEPDIISILIGVNDVWHRYYPDRIETTDRQIETNYRAILERLRTQTRAKIVMLSPFSLDGEVAEEVRRDLKILIPMVRRLGEEFADVFISMDELFAGAIRTQPEPCCYARDGVHPNAEGARFIGETWAEWVKPLIG